jgi:hypothetical protein
MFDGDANRNAGSDLPNDYAAMRRCFVNAPRYTFQPKAHRSRDRQGAVGQVVS